MSDLVGQTVGVFPAALLAGDRSVASVERGGHRARGYDKGLDNEGPENKSHAEGHYARIDRVLEAFVGLSRFVRFHGWKVNSAVSRGCRPFAAAQAGRRLSGCRGPVKLPAHAD